MPTETNTFGHEHPGSQTSTRRDGVLTDQNGHDVELWFWLSDERQARGKRV